MSDDQMDMIDVRQFIVDLRGGIPERCDFCGKPTPPEQMEPEEAGDWVCHTCMKHWNEQEDS